MSLNPEYLAPARLPLARRDPRWRLAAFVLAVVGVARSASWPSLAALGLALLLAVFGRVPARRYRARIGVLARRPCAVPGRRPVHGGSRRTALGMATPARHRCRSNCRCRFGDEDRRPCDSGPDPSSQRLPCTSRCAAAGKLGVPRLFVHLTLLTYRYMFLLLDELNRLRMALRVRGFRNAMTGTPIGPSGK